MDIQSVKNRIRLSELVGRDVRLRKTGKEYSGCCPFHDEKSPSFSVNNEKGLYYCFSCGATGDAITYLTDKKGMHFKDAITYLADMSGLVLPKSFFKNDEENTDSAQEPLLELFGQAAKIFHQSLTDSVKRYLKQRNVADEMVKKFKIGFCPSSEHLYTELSKQFSDRLLSESGLFVKNNEPRFKNRLMFPIRNKKGFVIAFGGRALGDDNPKYLNSSENPFFKKKETLYGFFEGFNIEKKQQYIFVEGYLDVIKLHQHGFTGAVSPLGTALSTDHIQKVWRYCSKPIISMDGDIAGQKAQFRSVERMLPFITPYKTINLVALPDGFDPDNLMDHDPSAFEKLIKAPQPIVNFLQQYFEKKLKQHKTPEEIMTVQDDITNLCQQIKHTGLSKIYLTQLNKFLWRYIYKGVPETTSVKKLIPVKNNRLLQEILLATIINHPIILDEVHENLGRASLPEKDLEQLRCQILDRYYNNNNEVIEYPFDYDRLVLFAPFVRANTEQEKVCIGWWEVWNRIFCSHDTETDDWTVKCVRKQLFLKE